MEENYYKLVNFVTRLSKPKLKEDALVTHGNFTEKRGSSAIDIFEDGIDNAEAIIAIEARKILSALSKTLDITKITKESQKITLDEEQVIKKAFLATGGNARRMSEITGISLRNVYSKMKKFDLDKKAYSFKEP